MNRLIVVIVNQGYEEEVMAAARSAGARGGTTFNARGTAKEEDVVKLLGITLNPDKEIVFILTEEENQVAIMTAVKNCAGLATKGGGLVFSLPVDSIME